MSWTGCSVLVVARNNVDLGTERAEAGRILLTTSSHSGLSTDDRSYLIQQVGRAYGLSGPMRNEGSIT